MRKNGSQVAINYHQIENLLVVASTATQDNLGDVLEKVIKIRSKISNKATNIFAESILRDFRSLVANAKPGWKLFNSPRLPDKDLNDIECLQLWGVEEALHELCFCFENLEWASTLTGERSTGTRFYLNSIYHYISSMFLVDTSKPSHEGLPMGGTVIKALHPLGIADLLEPINGLLQKQHGGKTIGETVLLLRHSHLVHGDFSPHRVEYIIESTQMRNPQQSENFTNLLWDLFYQLQLFRLKILAIFTHMKIDFIKVISRYISNLAKDDDKM
jgi:hypothetical protein